MTVLVTGAFGFLGASLTRYLAATGHDVVATDLRPADEGVKALLAPFAESIATRLLDVGDSGACRAVLHDIRPSHVIHAAALTQTDSDAATVTRTFSVNLGGTMNLLAAAAKCGEVERVVIASSSGVYGPQPGDTAIGEDDTLHLGNAYAASKRASELVAATYDHLPGMSVVAGRIGPVYGPCEQIRTSRPRVTVIARLFEALAAGRPVTLAGREVCRDWTHADDIAAGLAGLLMAPVLHHPVYNISAGRAVRFAEIADWFEGQGIALSWTDDPGQADIALAGSDSRRPLDITRLETDAGFAPAFDLAGGLARVAADLGLRQTSPIPG